MARGKYEKIMLREVVCFGYLREARDSVRIEQGISDEDSEEDIFGGDAETHFFLIDSEGHRRELSEPGDGGEKQYYALEDLEKPFKGVCVGVRNITVTAKLFYGEHQDESGKRLYPFIGKQPVNVVQCALVFYGNMRKRWVPLSKIELEEKDDGQLMIPGIPKGKKSPVVPIEDIIPEKKPCIVVDKKRSSTLDEEGGFKSIEDDDIPF